ncbi:hypothetical protein ARMGADRAFT_1028588 [Armillaria gallica]|uniref:Uncharacterized protein n=1 Tax=Armillaria gallica TaxID=47427 RepID=A0A2H3E3Q9_ARMGA|nr:hypothetical protein ARMGADRAFT_1028588 [Armillaria gallica]
MSDTDACNSSEAREAEQAWQARHELQWKYERRYDTLHREMRQQKAVERMRAKREATKLLKPEEQAIIRARNKVAQDTYRQRDFMDLYAQDIDAMPERPRQRRCLHHPEDYPPHSERLMAEMSRLSST